VIDKRGWQDVMVEHREETDWAKEALTPETSIIYCGRLCETILKLEQRLDSAREVIAFYGKENNQIAPIYKPTGKPGSDFTSPFRMDKGRRARQWLKENE